MELLCKLKSEYQSLKVIENFLKDYEKRDIFLQFNMSVRPYLNSYRLSLFKIEDESLNNFFRLYLKVNISEEMSSFFVSSLDRLMPLVCLENHVYIKDRFMCAIFKEKEVLAYLEVEFNVFDYAKPDSIKITISKVIFNVSLLEDFIKEIKSNDLFGCFEEDIMDRFQGRFYLPTYLNQIPTRYIPKKINVLDYLSDFLKEIEKRGTKFLELKGEADNLFLLKGIKLHEKGFKIIFSNHENFSGNCDHIPNFIHTIIKKDYEDENKAERMKSVIIQQKESIKAYLSFDEFLEYSAKSFLKKLKINIITDMDIDEAITDRDIDEAKGDLFLFFTKKLSLFSNIFFNTKIILKSDFFETTIAKISESVKENLKSFETYDKLLKNCYTSYIDHSFHISLASRLSKLMIEGFHDLFSREVKNQKETELTFKTKEGQKMTIKLIRNHDYKEIRIRDYALGEVMVIYLKPDGKVYWAARGKVIFDKHEYKDFTLKLANIVGISEKEVYFLIKKMKKEILL